jgi:hypothetical protein
MVISKRGKKSGRYVYTIDKYEKSAYRKAKVPED